MIFLWMFQAFNCNIFIKDLAEDFLPVVTSNHIPKLERSKSPGTGIIWVCWHKTLPALVLDEEEFAKCDYQRSRNRNRRIAAPCSCYFSRTVVSLIKQYRVLNGFPWTPFSWKFDR